MDRQRGDDAAARPPGTGRWTVLRGVAAGAAAALLGATGPAAKGGVAQGATPGAAAGWFLVIRRYELAPGATLAEVVRRTEEDFVPIVRQVPGFVEYYNVDLGEGQGATVSVFASREGAAESTARAAAWVRENVAELLAGPPEVMQGSVLLHVDAGAPAGTPGP